MELWHTFVCLPLHGLCKCCRWPGYWCWCYWDVGHFHYVPGPPACSGCRGPQAQSLEVRRQVAAVPDAQLPWPRRFSGQEAGVLYKLPDQCCQAPWGCRLSPQPVQGHRHHLHCLRLHFLYMSYPPAFRCIDPRNCPETWCAEQRHLFLSYGCFTDYISKGKETEIISFHSDAGHH